MNWSNRLAPGAVRGLGRRAAGLLRDKVGLQRLLARAMRLAPKLPRVAAEELQALMRMLRAYLGRQYTDLPLATLLKAIAAVIYFVDPLDILPDPVYIDDAAVITWVINSLRLDLSRFRVWEQTAAAREPLLPPVDAEGSPEELCEPPDKERAVGGGSA